MLPEEEIDTPGIRHQRPTLILNNSFRLGTAGSHELYMYVYSDESMSSDQEILWNL